MGLFSKSDRTKVEPEFEIPDGTRADLAELVRATPLDGSVHSSWRLQALQPLMRVPSDEQCVTLLWCTHVSPRGSWMGYLLQTDRRMVLGLGSYDSAPMSKAVPFGDITRFSVGNDTNKKYRLLVLGFGGQEMILRVGGNGYPDIDERLTVLGQAAAPRDPYAI